MEQQWIEQAKRGDAYAFEQLVRAYEKRVYNIALRFTGEPSDAFDVSQEVFLRVYNSLPGFKGESAFSTWLYRLTNNICLDFLRRQKRRRENETSLYTVDDEGQEALTELPDLRYAPETDIERSELRESLYRAMNRLSVEHRQILAMRELADLSYQEIAQALELEPGTVKSRLARAREQMRVFLLQEGTFPPFGASKQ